MKKIIGGAIATILGLICFSVFFPAFLNLLAGIIPFLLLAGGGLALYLRHQEQASEESQGYAEDTGTTDLPCCEAPLETEKKQTLAVPARPKETESPPPAQPAPVEKTDVSPDAHKPDAPRFCGNTGSHVFHSIECPYSTSKLCTAAFSTREQAIQEDYKPCGICNP